MGDFNLHHTRWQSSWSRSTSRSPEQFVDWVESNNLSLLLPIDEATHNRGKVLDLAFGSCSLIAKSHCAVASHLDTTSDHASLLTMVDWIEHNVPQRKLRPDTLDSMLFNRLLFISINQVAPLPPSPNPDSLDTFALGLTDAIRLAYSGSARRTLGYGTGSKFPDKVPATTLAEKREIFAANLLVNLAEAGVIPLYAPSVSVRTLIFPPLSRQEVRDTLLKAGYNVPGLDEIPTAILRCAWPRVADLVHSLFSGCISLGYHPHCFRQAILIMIEKPNKPDLSSPRTYRPIALLSVLGKGLERLLAKRMSWIAIRHKIIAIQQFGALPGRSAVDLTICLTHDVGRALSEGRSASMLTLDLKGSFDAVLPGRLHVNILASKALKVANPLRSLGNTFRGCNSTLFRQAKIACILPIAYYGAETWWPGRYPAAPRNCTVSNRVDSHISLLRKVALSSARAILPVYLTTPTPILYRDAGLLPDIELDVKLRQSSLRIHRLDPRHPLRRRAIWALSHGCRIYRLFGWAFSLPKTEFLDPLLLPPSHTQDSWYSCTRRVTSSSLRPQVAIPSQDILAYSDGGRAETESGRRVGGGVAIMQAGRVVLSKPLPLSPTLEVFDAEAFTALHTVELALSLPSARFANNLWVFLDHLDVARLLLSTPLCSCQEAFIRFANNAAVWPLRQRLPHTVPGKIIVRWIPGHSGIWV
ncbi:hypothetical protein K3495_g11059 [Podosphaera aphanis]|nr:hypothetical protein K3495_g11059 [Podosphaera aphanis]